MNRSLFAVCVLALAVLFPAGSQQVQKAKGSVCWPLHFAGITVGLTTDSQLQRLLGHGIFRPNEGHTGGRYFLDTKQTGTLHVVEGVDKVVEDLNVSVGIDPAVKPSDRDTAVSKWFEPQEGFGNWHGVHLGSAKEDVLKNLGEPQARLNPNEWLYQTTCSCEIPDDLTIVFKEGRVIQLKLSEEE
jgi:hypothetical protein